MSIQSTDEGEQVWRQIKANTASFSIGFKSESRPRKGGKGREIYEIDLLEISFTSTPIHPSARVLSWKSTADADLDEMTDAELRERSMAAIAGIKTKSRRPVVVTSFPC